MPFFFSAMLCALSLPPFHRWSEVFIVVLELILTGCFPMPQIGAGYYGDDFCWDTGTVVIVLPNSYLWVSRVSVSAINTALETSHEVLYIGWDVLLSCKNCYNINFLSNGKPFYLLIQSRLVPLLHQAWSLSDSYSIKNWCTLVFYGKGSEFWYCNFLHCHLPQWGLFNTVHCEIFKLHSLLYKKY